MREEAGDIAQERALALHAPQLLEEGQSHYLRIGDLLEDRIAPSLGVEVAVGVVYHAEQDRNRLLQEARWRGILWFGHLKSTRREHQMASVLPQTTQQTSRTS